MTLYEVVGHIEVACESTVVAPTSTECAPRLQVPRPPPPSSTGPFEEQMLTFEALMSGFGSDRLLAAAATTPSEEVDDAILGRIEERGGCAGRVLARRGK